MLIVINPSGSRDFLRLIHIFAITAINKTMMIDNVDTNAISTDFDGAGLETTKKETNEVSNIA